MSTAFVSCSDENDVLGKEQDNKGHDSFDTPEDVEVILNKALTEWGASLEEVTTHMKGYELDNVSDNNTLSFSDTSGKKRIAYRFNNGRLCATLIVLNTDLAADSMMELSDFKYLGKLDDCNVYEDEQSNTMATLWNEITDQQLVIGYTPIKSDYYEPAEDISVVTGDFGNIGVATIDLSGTVTGVDNVVEVGFIYSTDINLSEMSGLKVSSTSTRDFTISVSGLYDETKYYYCAYAVIDDIYYLGDIKEFTTKPYTYVMGGRTFGLVRIEGNGDDIKPFSMMQTELTDLYLVDENNDGVVTVNEIRTFMNGIRRDSGLEFRFPTSNEWLYAANGGDFQDKWMYSGSDVADDVAWHKGNSGGYAHEPALKSPNSIGLYDMCGNYQEVCASNTYKSFNNNINTAVDGILRGGSWNDYSSDCKIVSTAISPTTGRIPTSSGSVSDLYAFDASKIRFRLVYSRHEKAADENK
jgi:hypothetical protein